jgi:hypothetical protein
MNFNQLPNFFIIGAGKSGTTSLFEILAEHPAVYGAKTKETRFFNHNDRFAQGINWYLDNYFPDAVGFKIRVEATPAYLTWSQKVAPRIKALYGDRPVKFAAIFRDPVKRAYSHYWHRVRLGNEDSNLFSFEDAIHSENNRIQENWQRLEHEGNGLYGYFRAGCYASLLKPYLDLFPRESFHFLLQEDLYKDFKPSMSKLLRFLDIDDEYPLKPVISNESAVPRNQKAYNLFNSLKKTKHKDLLKSFIPTGVRKWFRRDGLMKPFNYPPMGDEIKRELYTRYAEEIKRLETIIGRDLSHWEYQENVTRINRDQS